MANKIKLLGTALLPDIALSPEQQEFFSLDAFPFISTRHVLAAVSVPLNTPAVFTSAEAVRVVAALGIACHEVYCLQEATQEAVAELLPSSSILATAPNALQLAKIIAEQHCQQLVFYCGNLSLPTLPDYLAERGIEVQRQVIYHTELTPVAVKEAYAGILFFSPSAVDSYFSLNMPETTTVLFAIGTTTETAIRHKTTNTVVKAPRPTKAAVLTTAINHFTATFTSR
jgi:uroporphyrinogen-III synthase